MINARGFSSFIYLGSRCCKKQRWSRKEQFSDKVLEKKTFFYFATETRLLVSDIRAELYCSN